MGKCGMITMVTIFVSFFTWIVLILVTVDVPRHRTVYLLFAIWVLLCTSLCWVPLLYEVVCEAIRRCRAARCEVVTAEINAPTGIRSQESCGTGNACLNCAEQVGSLHLSCYLL